MDDGPSAMETIDWASDRVCAYVDTSCMPRHAQWTRRPFVEEVPRLLAGRGLSQRQLAAMAGVHQSHLSRVLRGKKNKSPSRDLAARVARAFGLPEEYFAEYREAVVVEHVRSDAALRDRLFRRLTR